MKIAMMAQAGSVHTTRWSLGLARRGHRVCVISNSRYKFESNEIETIYLPGYSPLSYFLNIPRVKKVIKRFRPDIVHSHYATGYGLWGTLSGETPFIVTVWGTDIEDAVRGRFMIAPTVRRVLRRARFVTSASRFLIDRTVAFEKSAADKIIRIPFGVPIPEISVRKPIDEVEGIIHIVYTKTFRPAYAPDLALMAFARAYREDPRLRLTMIGGGPMKQTLRDMAGQLGINDSANIRGWQDMQETRRLIESADIMLMPSRHESFGVAALEATSHGVPVVATRVGGLPEIIEDGTNGILVPVDDAEAVKKALLKLAADPRLRNEMGRAGQAMSRERYDFERCLDMMEDLYGRALAS